MEFLLTGNTGENPTRSKAKLAKFRHYDSLLMHLLTIALALFLLFQNQRLKEQIRRQPIDEVVEDLLQERLTPILKEMEEIKGAIFEENGKVVQRQHEIINLVKVAGRELGLADLTDKEPEVRQKLGARKTYEVVEVYGNEEEDSNQENSDESQGIKEVPIQNRQHKKVKRLQAVQKSDEICTYEEYLFEKKKHYPVALWYNPVCLPVWYPHYPVTWRDRVNYSSSFILESEEEQDQKQTLFVQQLRGLATIFGTILATIVGLAAFTLIAVLIKKSDKTRKIIRLLFENENDEEVKKKPTQMTKSGKILFE